MAFAWADVTGICGFCDGSCRTVGCVASMWINNVTGALGWHTVLKKCELVPGVNSLFAEICGCSMLIERVSVS